MGDLNGIFLYILKQCLLLEAQHFPFPKGLSKNAAFSSIVPLTYDFNYLRKLALLFLGILKQSITLPTSQ